MEPPSRKPDPIAGAGISLPLVSIVIPSYNHGRYLGTAIDSVLAQDYPRIELIVIDDGSTDESREVLARYTGRIHWERQSNQGQAVTLNRGWLMSRGDILGYLSADDFLLPGAVSRAESCLRQNPDAALVYCDFNLVDPDSAVVRRIRAPEVDYCEMLKHLICPPGPGAFFRRSAFEKAGLWDATLRQMADYEYWLRLGMHGRFVRLPEVLAAYRVHPGSQTFAGTSKVRAEEPVRIIKSYFERQNVPDSVKAIREQAFSVAHLVSAQLHFRGGNYGDGFAALWRAFELKPRSLFSFRLMRILFNATFNRLGHRIFWTARRVLGSLNKQQRCTKE
jgi:glycosyltransferase involved in cell wall biosynthesis